MSKKSNPSHSASHKHFFLCAAVLFLLPLCLAGKASAQSSAGPLPGAAPSDQPVASPAHSAGQVAAKPNLAGTWKLNVDQSDNPMQKMRQAQQDSGGSGGGRGRGGWGGGGGMGGGGWGGQNGGGQNGGDQNGGGPPNGGDEGQPGGGGRRQGGLRGMAQLVIEQTPTSAKVSDANGRALALYLASSEPADSHVAPADGANNGANNGEGRGPNAAPAVAQWVDNKLVSTQQMRNGGTTTRTYELSPDNKQLIVTTKVENKRFKEPVTFRQVYDPVYASTGGQ
jgi:hypothetical protein